MMLKAIAMMLKAIASTIAIREGILQLDELNQRRQIFRQAREYADITGRPLLVIGTPKHAFSHPYGDVTIDIDERRVGQGNTELADVRDIPYPSGYFGAAYCSHVLEHLPTVQDAVEAIEEMERVADKVFTVSPHKTSLLAQLYPGHHLWVIPSGDGYIIEQRGTGAHSGEEEYIISMQVLQPEDHRYGEPRTDEEREERHEELHPGTPLPERGSGRISQIDVPGAFGTAVVIGVGLGLGFLLFNTISSVIKGR